MDSMPWEWRDAFGGPVDSPVGGRPEDLSRVNREPLPLPPDLDRWLITLTYRVIAAGSSCQKCGAGFTPRVRVVPSSGDTQGLCYLLVVAKCRGWKRHISVASVAVKTGQDTPLEPLRPIHRQMYARLSGGWW
jgi:hypothetical protein